MNVYRGQIITCIDTGKEFNIDRDMSMYVGGNFIFNNFIYRVVEVVPQMSKVYVKSI